MMAVLIRRLLGIGKLPNDMRAQVDGEGLLYLEEFVPVTYRFSGSVPGKVAKGEVRSYVGALAFTSQRVLGTLSTVPKKAGRAIDQPWGATPSGAVTAEIGPTGLSLSADIARIDPSFNGRLSLAYKSTIPAEVLSKLPTLSLAFDVPREYVTRALGTQLMA